MALDMSGKAVPAALIADPFAHQVALTSQTGVMAMVDGGMNPLDLFHSFSPSNSYGAALIILNSLSTPLTLVETFDYWAGQQNPMPTVQLSYPATEDLFTGGGVLMKEHQIPGARPYPRQSRHPLGQGVQTIGGLGLYRFKGNYVNCVQRAMSFSYHEDGSGPYIGVAFLTIVQGSGFSTWFSMASAVTADVAGQYGDLKNFYLTTMGNADGNAKPTPNPATKQYDVGGPSSPLAIWATTTSLRQPPAYEPNMVPLVMWVRDAASTLGLN